MTTPPPTPATAEKRPAAAPMRMRRVVLPWICVRDLTSDLRDHPGDSALVFDIDGVLAPIVAHADDARVPDRVLDLLTGLLGRYRLVGVISGRAITDVDRLVPVPGLARGGNHGLEVAEAGHGPRIVPAATDAIAVLRGFVAGLEPRVLTAHGVWLEDKGASVSLHYRQAPDPGAAGEWLRAEVGPAALAAGVRIRNGKMILELLPDVDVDKGTALRTLVTAAGARRVLYVGDDHTDADAWRVLRAMRAAGHLDAAYCVLADGPEVDPTVRDAADTVLDGPVGVAALLAELAR